MASASTIPPRPVETLSTCSLSGGEEDNEGDWELVSPPRTNSTSEAQTQAQSVTFSFETIQKDELEGDNTSRINPKTLKHSQSSPDLRRYSICEEDLEEERLLPDTQDDSTLETSKPALVPPSQTTASSSSSWGSSKLSFRDAILQNGQGDSHSSSAPSQGHRTPKSRVPQPQRKFQGVRFQVVETKKSSSMRRGFQSMPDLHVLEHEGEGSDVLGETDAGDYYARKAQGAQGRANGSKLRPDEAKRLKMTMAKKNMQREKQKQRGR